MEIMKGKVYRDYPVNNNVREAFEQAVAKFGDFEAFAWRPNLNDKIPTTITYRELYNDFNALQVALYDETIETRRVAIIGVNSYHWSLSYLGAVCGMGVAVPLDPLLTAMEIVNLLKRGEVDTLICDARFVPILAPHFDELSFIKHRYYMLLDRETDKKKEQIKNLSKELHFNNFNDLLAKGYEMIGEGKKYISPEIFPDTEIALLFTSGTTNESKGVILTHYNVTSNVAGMHRFLNIPNNFTYLSILPLHHCLENTCGLHTVMSFGGKICYCDGLRYINQNLEEYKPFLLIGVPALFDSFQKKILLGVKKQKKEAVFNKARKVSKFLRKFGIDLRRKLFKSVIDGLGGNLKVCISGAAHQRIEVIQFMDELGIDILQGYGLTECAPVVSGCNTQDNPVGSCGYALGGMTIAVDNDAPGEEGEILVKKGIFPNHRSGWKNEPPTKSYDDDIHIVMNGYYKNEEATNEVFEKDGWIRTMDIGHFDPKTKGLVLTGRAKSMIVLNSGKKVFPEEIEAKINSIDLVSDSLVWAEQIHNDLQLLARVVLDMDVLDVFKSKRKGMSEMEIKKDIEDFLTKEFERINSEMIKFKRIRHFYFSEVDIIKTTTRKIKRKPEIELLHNFFKARNLGDLNLEIKNLDSIDFAGFAKGE